MDKLQIHPTSSRSAVCDPIVLRETATVRLVFLPTLVDNPTQPEACINGEFVYQRKGKNEQWESVNELSLITIKKGEAYKLELHSDELYKLGTELRSLYQYHRERGQPRSPQTLVRLQAGLARFFALSEPELRQLLDGNPESAVDAFGKILRWLSGAEHLGTIADRLAAIAPDEFPSMNALLGLASLKKALMEWRANRNNRSEEYWQGLLGKHSAVLSQILAYPIIVIQEKAYLGGKQLDNTGGKVLDFLARVTMTRAAVLLEIKTPSTDLLGGEYRSVYPFSHELNGSIAQVLNYRQTLLTNLPNVAAAGTLTIAEPRCVVIAGDAARELTDDVKQTCFELLRERLSGVTVITFDELFARVEQVIGAIEGAERS